MDYKQYNVSPCIFPAAEINLFPDGKQDKRAERIFRIIQEEVGGAAGGRNLVCCSCRVGICSSIRVNESVVVIGITGQGPERIPVRNCFRSRGYYRGLSTG